MGCLSIHCDDCDFEAEGVNTRRCPQCGSFETYITSDEEPSSAGFQGDDE